MDGSIEALLTSEPADLSHDERLDLLLELDRLAARVAARTQRVLAAVHRDPPPMLPGAPQKIRDKAFVRDEVACLLRLSPLVAGGRLHDAADLVSRLPATLADLEAGRFSFWHARALLEGTSAVDPTIARKVERHVLPRASEQTLANFRRSVDRAVLRLDPRRAENKARDAVQERRVVCSPERNGMASLYAYLPAVDAERIMVRVARAAGQMKGLDDRSADQRHADALVELLCGTRGTRGGHAEVQVTLSLDTLTGCSDEPGELAGYGPLPAGVAADLARALSADPATRVRPCSSTSTDCCRRTGSMTRRGCIGPVPGCTPTWSPGTAPADSPAAAAAATAANSTTSSPRWDEHDRRESAVFVSKTSPFEARSRLASHPRTRRHHPLDHTQRTQI